MEANQSKTSADLAVVEDPSGFCSELPPYSNLDDLRGGKSDLGSEKMEGLLRRIKANVRLLNRKRDVVCVILSYPPFNSRNNETHRVWIRDVLEITHKVRQVLYKGKEGSVSQLSPEITRLLRHSIHDIEAHVPSHDIVEMCNLWATGPGTPKKPMLDLCIDDLMIRQILQYIQIPEIRKIRIPEETDQTFLSRLKNLPPIRKMFDLVVQVNVIFCRKVKDIEDRIIERMGFSKSCRGEAEELLRSQNFLILLEDFSTDAWLDPHDIGNRWWNSDNIQKIALIGSQYGQLPKLVDLEISRKDHLLPWNLFCRNVGEVVHSSSIQQLVLHVFKQCYGHLVATVLMARALKEVEDVHIWQYASRVMGLLPTSHTEDTILFNALAFVRGRLSSGDKFLKYCTSYLGMEAIDKVDLIERWMKEGLIGAFNEGEEIVQHLVDAFLLESFWDGESVRMQDEIHKELVNLYEANINPIVLLELDGSGLTEAPKNEAWEEANEIYLMNNKISKVPENPNCPKLSKLFLQVNHHLRVIPPFFFQYMPILQILDLSQTRIKSLPQSLFKLVQLRKFILRGCELIKELSSEVGDLCHLEVLDLEGTEIINLPVSVGKLTNLTCLKVSLYPQMNHKRKNIQSNTIIPKNVISNLLQLEELSIDVNPDDKRWNVIVQDIVKEVCNLNQLETLKLYLPEAILLNDLRNGSSSINLSSMHFRFIVGSHLKRIISRLPLEAVVKFEEERCLKYVNGEGVPTEIKEVLQHSIAFFLDRHSTVTSLSEFGIENMKNLKFCMIGECNEIQTILDTNDARDEDGGGGGGGGRDVVLGSLEYLILHYMKNLRSIWKGPLGRWKGRFGRWEGLIAPWDYSLYRLKALTLYSCPKLTTIFTLDLVENLGKLEELVVEDCPEINSILTHEVRPERVNRWKSRLPNLKKMSLHYMPKLVSISGGVRIGPRLEWLSFYDCPSLKTISPEEVGSEDLKVIIGEADWWSALKWSKSEQFQPPNLDAIFVPIERDIDLRTQLAEINDQLQAQMQETAPSKQFFL